MWEISFIRDLFLFKGPYHRTIQWDVGCLPQFICFYIHLNDFFQLTADYFPVKLLYTLNYIQSLTSNPKLTDHNHRKSCNRLRNNSKYILDKSGQSEFRNSQIILVKYVGFGIGIIVWVDQQLINILLLY